MAIPHPRSPSQYSCVRFFSGRQLYLVILECTVILLERTHSSCTLLHNLLPDLLTDPTQQPMQSARHAAEAELYVSIHSFDRSFEGGWVFVEEDSGCGRTTEYYVFQIASSCFYCSVGSSSAKTTSSGEQEAYQDQL